MHEDFSVDLSLLERERPNGVSGLMRVKNDSEFIEESVRSVISCLDELIICYQDSSDDTELKIISLHKEYPHKIKLYHYEPEVFSHNLSPAQIDLIETLSPSSVHLLSNYYNYTLSKATYRYGVKIDADQIYITEKFQEICDLYRQYEPLPVSGISKIAYFYFKVLRRMGVMIPLISNKILLSFLLPPILVKQIRRYIKGKIQNDKIIASFEGLNVYLKKEQVFICGGCFSDGCQPPIGGCGDHIFFPINSKNVYYPLIERNNNRVIEVMRTSSETFFGLGFLWIHLNAMRKNQYPKNIVKYEDKLLSFAQFSKIWSYKRFKLPYFIRPIVWMDYRTDKNILINKVKLFKDKLSKIINS